jgi:hypothetical protein
MTGSAARRQDVFGIKRITGAADLAAKGEPGSWVSEAAR